MIHTDGKPTIANTRLMTMSATDCLKVMQAAADHVSNVRTALTDPLALPVEFENETERDVYVVEELDTAINLLAPLERSGD